MLSHQYIDGYRDGAKSGPGYSHVIVNAVDGLLAGSWHFERRDDKGAYWRGYGAGFMAKVIGVDLSEGRA